MSGKDSSPRLPEASTTGSDGVAGCSDSFSPTGRCSAMRTASRASDALRVRCALRGTGSPQPALTRSLSVSPYLPAKVSPGLWPWSDSSTIR